MATMTLSELRTATRQRANFENNEFVTDSELDSYINQSLGELHGMVVQAFGEDYFITEVDLAYAANVAEADLPDDFFKVRTVEVLVTQGTPNRYVTIRQFNRNEINLYNSPGMVELGVINLWWSNLRYRLQGGKLILRPPPNSAITVRLAYMPQVTALVADDDETEPGDSVNGWLEYVIVDAAIKMRDKQETDTSVLREQRERIVKRIQSESANRDAGDGETIRDVNATGNGGWNWGWGGGF